MINMKGVALALVFGVLAFGSYIIYEKGYEDAVKDRRIEELEIVKKTQLEVKEKYEKEIKDLISAHERERAGYIDRMHELKNSNHPVETWQPALVNEASLRDWQFEVRNYSRELSRILKQVPIE